MITIAVCIMCVLLGTCCFRAVMGAREDSGLIDWQQFESPDPNWD